MLATQQVYLTQHDSTFDYTSKNKTGGEEPLPFAALPVYLTQYNSNFDNSSICQSINTLSTIQTSSFDKKQPAIKHQWIPVNDNDFTNREDANAVALKFSDQNFKNCYNSKGTTMFCCCNHIDCGAHTRVREVQSTSLLYRAKYCRLCLHTPDRIAITNYNTLPLVLKRIVDSDLTMGKYPTQIYLDLVEGAEVHCLFLDKKPWRIKAVSIGRKILLTRNIRQLQKAPIGILTRVSWNC